MAAQEKERLFGPAARAEVAATRAARRGENGLPLRGRARAIRPLAFAATRREA